MTQVSITQTAKENHSTWTAHVLATLKCQPGEGQILLRDATETAAHPGKHDRSLALQRGGVDALVRQDARSHALSYSDPASEAVRAAALAATAQAGMPVCADSGSLALLTLAQRVAHSDIPVLIEGPTGTGKEVISRFLHSTSPRREGPFVAVNCAAMPEAMLEALLFGHRKGAFTGASEAGEGFFRAAHTGTLLLDEIGEMPLGLQAKLLRTLQEGEVVPIGATKPVKVDVRVIACTNRNLPQEVAEGSFRSDLYYRLNVFPLQLDALRERPDDIAPLAFAMLLRHAPAQRQSVWIADAALAKLRAHSWPGNVRELENVIRRALLLAGEDTTLQPDHIRFDSAVRALEMPEPNAPRATASSRAAQDKSLSAIVRQSESEVIMDTLDRHNGNRMATARELGISERTLRYRLASMREAGLAVAGGRR